MFEEFDGLVHRPQSSLPTASSPEPGVTIGFAGLMLPLTRVLYASRQRRRRVFFHGGTRPRGLRHGVSSLRLRLVYHTFKSGGLSPHGSVLSRVYDGLMDEQMKPSGWTSPFGRKQRLPIYEALCRPRVALIKPAHRLLIERGSGIGYSWVWCDECKGWHLEASDVEISVESLVSRGSDQGVATSVPVRSNADARQTRART